MTITMTITMIIAFTITLTVTLTVIDRLLLYCYTVILLYCYCYYYYYFFFRSLRKESLARRSSSYGEGCPPALCAVRTSGDPSCSLDPKVHVSRHAAN